MYRKRYPPARFVFYPLYRIFRKRLRLPAPLAYFLVSFTSAILHGLLFLVTDHPVGAVVMVSIFLVLGTIGAGAIHLKEREKKNR